MCRLFSNIVDVSTLEGKRDLFIFEEDVEPDWDEPAIADGGLWLVHASEALSADGSLEPRSLHTIWMDTVCYSALCVQNGIYSVYILGTAPQLPHQRHQKWLRDSLCPICGHERYIWYLTCGCTPMCTLRSLV
jgi:hypothetical protein